MRPRSSYSVSPPKVIVSRSHSGEVKNFIHKAFGNGTIVQAGGAGKWRTLLHRLAFISSQLKVLQGVICHDDGQLERKGRDAHFSSQ